MLDMVYILNMHVHVLASSFKTRKISKKLYSSPKTYRIHHTKILGWFLCLWKVNRLVCIILAMSHLGKTCFRTLHGNMVRMLTYMVVHGNPHVPTC